MELKKLKIRTRLTGLMVIDNNIIEPSSFKLLQRRTKTLPTLTLEMVSDFPLSLARHINNREVIKIPPAVAALSRNGYCLPDTEPTIAPIIAGRINEIRDKSEDARSV